MNGMERKRIENVRYLEWKQEEGREHCKDTVPKLRNKYS
jgi:hypothetical protein